MLINYLSKPRKHPSSNGSISFPGFIKPFKIFPRTIYSGSGQKSCSSLKTALPKLERSEKKKGSRPEFFPKVSAKAWIVYDQGTQSVVLGRKQYAKREIASITKVMTCVVAIEELIRSKKDIEELVEISLAAGSVKGTTAGLAFKDQLRLIDLFFALMLPSGNDAAIALSEYFGKLIQPHQEEEEGSDKAKFINKMNEKAQSLGMKDTHFTNPHGMSTSVNVSTAYDLAILCEHALKIPLFKEVVSCAEYSCEVVARKKGVRKVVWKNTNKMLGKGFYGVKTGFTPVAGPCLSCAIGNFVMVLLGCESRHDRWKDSLELFEFVKKRGSIDMNA